MPHSQVWRSLSFTLITVAATALALCGGAGLAFPDGAVSERPAAGGGAMIRGLATVIYPVPDLERAKTWYAEAFGQRPYFDEPFYVGFNIAGYELGLDPNGERPGPGGGVAYWRVPEIGAAVQHFTSAGARLVAPAADVGGGIKVATVADPFGNPIGLIENPHYRLP
jgi:predicted enzyme related to lactoylglutathione lyase